MIDSLYKLKVYLPALAVVVCVFVPFTADARVTGEAELGYTSYDATFNGQGLDASSFLQRYSLLYSNSGLLKNGRLGRYKYDLGYEWTSFDSKISASDSPQADKSQTSGHLLYQGEVLFRPPTLPLYLKAYSRDLSRSGFLDDFRARPGDAILIPGITGSLINGTHIRSGLFLGLGVKDENNLPFFKHVPKLFVDYTDSYDRDLKNENPVDSRLSSLTVSLIKGDAAVTYWRTEVDDKIHPTSGYNEQRYIVGNVSYREGRKWVDLSNWIKVSADISHAKRISRSSDEGVSTEYDLNLFAMASRARWEMTNLNNFNRLIERNVRTEEMRLPVYVKGTWNKDTDWQLRLQSFDTKSTGLALGINDKKSDQLASIQVNTFRREMFTLSPSAYVERLEDSLTENLTIGAAVETASTRRFSSVYALFGRYSIEGVTSNQGDNKSSAFTRHTLTARGIYKATDNLKLELEEQFKASTGAVLSEGIASATASSGGSISPATSSLQETTSSFYRSTTKFSAAWVPVARLRLGLVLTGDVLQQKDTAADIVTSATNTVDYTLPTFNVGSSLTISKRTFGEEDKTEITTSSVARYIPNKTTSSEVRLMLSQQNENGTTTTNLDLFQRYRYSFFSASGHGRKLLDIVEELSWLKRRYAVPGAPEALDAEKRLAVGTDYFVTRNLILSATIRYSLLDPGNKKELLGSGGIAFNFNKLQANMEYSYGKRDGKGENRVEKRFAANLRKQF